MDPKSHASPPFTKNLKGILFRIPKGKSYKKNIWLSRKCCKYGYDHRVRVRVRVRVKVRFRVRVRVRAGVRVRVTVGLGLGLRLG